MNAGCLANVVRIRLEGEPPYSQSLILQYPEGTLNLAHEAIDSVLVHLLDFAQKGEAGSEFLCHIDEGLKIFGQTKSPITNPGIQKTGADTRIHTQPFGHVLNVGARRLAKVTDHIDIRDFEGEETIRGMFDNFRRVQVRQQDLG